MKQVVIVESGPTATPQKMGEVLRNRGYETVLISVTGKDHPSFAKAYDKRIFLGFEFVKVSFRNLPMLFVYFFKNIGKLISGYLKIKKLKPYVMIPRAPPNWMCCVFKFIFRKYPFIYYAWDVRSFVYNNRKEALAGGVPSFELNAEKYCLENADGIIHKKDEDGLEHLDPAVFGRKVKITAPSINFLPYCLERFNVPVNKNKLSKKDGELHLVFVGHISYAKSFLTSMSELVKGKVHLHLYGKTTAISKKNSYNTLCGSDYKDLVKSKYLHLHPQIPQEDLSKEISKYDYGIWLGYHDATTKNITKGMGNKFASYLEAGIPFFYFKNHGHIDKLMKKYGLNLGITFDDLRNLNKKVKKLNYNKLVNNVVKARKDFEMGKQIVHLEKFFEDAINYRNSRKS